jgi:hypothetical protein
MGIEPTPSAWKAEVLPLNYTRQTPCCCTETGVSIPVTTIYLVEGGGFEPPKAEPSDLQSDPFDRSGTPPKCKPAIVLQALLAVNSNTWIAARQASEVTLPLPGLPIPG